MSTHRASYVATNKFSGVSTSQAITMSDKVHSVLISVTAASDTTPVSGFYITGENATDEEQVVVLGSSIEIPVLRPSGRTICTIAPLSGSIDIHVVGLG
jgi:hypothetical protein